MRKIIVEFTYYEDPVMDFGYKVVGWRRLGFKKRKHKDTIQSSIAGYSRDIECYKYVLKKEFCIEEDDSHLLGLTVSSVQGFLRELYNSIDYFGEYHWTIPQSITEGFCQAMRNPNIGNLGDNFEVRMGIHHSVSVRDARSILKVYTVYE